MIRRPLSLTAAALVAAAVLASPALALDVVTWNLLRYDPAVPLYNVAARQPHFRTVMANLSADVIITQEHLNVGSEAADSFLVNVLRVAQPGRVWKRGGYISTAESAVYYDSLTTIVSNVVAIATSGPRDVLVCLVRPRGYAAAAASFRLYSVHFNAGIADSALRRLECMDLRNALNTAPAGTHLLVGGDTNFYGSWEGGYGTLIASLADNDGRLKDPFDLPGTWNNGGYAIHHSQAPCTGGGCPDANFSGGGLDDRFDFFLSSYSLQDGEGLDLAGGSQMFAYGNDGFHYNSDVDGGGSNFAVPLAVASALRQSSDHLPVVWVMQIPARVVAASQLDLGDVIVGGPAPGANLEVANGAPPPADELSYSLVAPVGFTVPGGPFAHPAGAPTPNAHAVAMLTTTVGAKSGTLLVNNDDPDSTAKPVLLSGRVLAHAEPSFDSVAVVTEATLEFGEHVAGDFDDMPVRLHDRGYDPLQARLAVTAAGITGGSGRFSIVGGFSPLLLGATGATVNVRFDDTGATQDSLYTATLTFTTADEPLPGAGALPPLVVHLSAYAISGAVGVEPGAGFGLAFSTPRPNPARSRITFAFELPDARPASLALYDLGGRHVATLVDGAPGPGRHARHWDLRGDGGSRVPAGLYFARFRTPGLARTERVVVLP